MPKNMPVGRGRGYGFFVGRWVSWESLPEKRILEKNGFLQQFILDTWEPDLARKALALSTGSWHQAVGNLQLGNLAHTGNLRLTQAQENFFDWNLLVSSWCEHFLNISGIHAAWHLALALSWQWLGIGHSTVEQSSSEWSQNVEKEHCESLNLCSSFGLRPTTGLLAEALVIKSSWEDRKEKEHPIWHNWWIKLWHSRFQIGSLALQSNPFLCPPLLS